MNDGMKETTVSREAVVFLWVGANVYRVFPKCPEFYWKCPEFYLGG